MVEETGWGNDPWGIEAWGSPETESPGFYAMEIERVDGVVKSPGVFTFEIDN